MLRTEGEIVLDRPVSHWISSCIYCRVSCAGLGWSGVRRRPTGYFQGSFRVYVKSEIVLKSRDITLPTKVHIVKAMVFSVVMYRCENWTIKKVVH